MPLFSGSLFESVGPLSTYASQRGTTFLLIDERNGYYLVAKPIPANEACKSRVLMAMKNKLNVKTLYTRTGLVCDGVLTWEPLIDKDGAMQ